MTGQIGCSRFENEGNYLVLDTAPPFLSHIKSILESKNASSSHSVSSFGRSYDYSGAQTRFLELENREDLQDVERLWAYIFDSIFIDITESERTAIISLAHECHPDRMNVSDLELFVYKSGLRLLEFVQSAFFEVVFSVSAWISIVGTTNYLYASYLNQTFLSFLFSENYSMCRVVNDLFWNFVTPFRGEVEPTILAFGACISPLMLVAFLALIRDLLIGIHSGLNPYLPTIPYAEPCRQFLQEVGRKSSVDQQLVCCIGRLIYVAQYCIKYIAKAFYKKLALYTENYFPITGTIPNAESILYQRKARSIWMSLMPIVPTQGIHRTL